ncbi:biotin carboxylase N-terminal domain-containing protein [Streptomyces syringium]|uniref:biotin carboxylase N-terminal domain-containing protein n=1 Tax=Streptomyces syringium TaxID=76729 RepID=UPI00342FB797
MYKKVLIANRGEIAVRVARACREPDVRSVAVHSTPDRDSAVVRLADEAIRIGPAAPAKSYLNAAAVLEAAAQSGADAIHPGYGFRSESPDFADACLARGITLIGPTPSVMARLGDKTSARALMRRVGLPLLPGSVEALDPRAAEELARRIGFPGSSRRPRLPPCRRGWPSAWAARPSRARSPSAIPAWAPSNSCSPRTAATTSWR